MIQFIFVFLMSSILNTQSYAQEMLKGPTPEQEIKIQEHNQYVNRLRNIQKNFSLREHKFRNSKSAEFRPFAEYEKNGYVIFSSLTLFDSLAIKQTIAKNLPQDVILIVYVRSSDEKESALLNFGSIISPERLKIVQIQSSDGNPFWARDAIPVPGVSTSSTSENQTQFRLTDAKYFSKFEPDQFFADLFGVELVSHQFYFEGGNFMPNALGECITINKGTLSSIIDDDTLKSHYGCKRIIRLPHAKGIGHIDEVVKFIADKVVITDTLEYKNTLENAGFEVHMMPKATPNTYQTYMNSLLINGTLFLPIFGLPTDQEAITIYESFGLKVIPIDSVNLAKGQGSIHCITMNYPPMPLQSVTLALKANELH